MNQSLERFSSRISLLQPEGAYAVLARAQEMEAAGIDVIHLEIGQPDVQTLANVTQAGIRAIVEGKTRYTPPPGIAELREAIAGYVRSHYRMDCSPQNVVVGPGAKPLLFFAMMSLLEPGDEVLYPDPGFPSYPAIIRAMGASPVPFPLDEERDFALKMDVLEDRLSPRTRMVILNSPSNPTGGVLPASDVEHVADIARRRDCWILSDEIYSRLVFLDSAPPAIGSLPDMARRTILVDGFSKTYAMTGWRLGFGVMPAELARRVTLLITHAIGCTASFTQWAGLEALQGPQHEVDRIREEYRRRRDVLVSGLNDIPGIRCQTPDGAFYTFPNIRSFGRSSKEMADILLEKAGVAVLPGTAFGANGEGYLRICFANSMTAIREASRRMGEVLGGIAPPDTHREAE
jgi:aspartate/methionine/tyrosine aminotransferase